MAYLTNVIDFHFFASHNVVYLVGPVCGVFFSYSSPFNVL